jgi:hypothetical protein
MIKAYGFFGFASSNQVKWYTVLVQGFDETTKDILEWELDAIHTALIRKEIDIHPHAFKAARDENIPPRELLAAVLVGRPTEKDLPDNFFNRFVGINFEHQMDDKRFIRVKLVWMDNYLVITAHTIRRSA